MTMGHGQSDPAARSRLGTVLKDKWRLDALLGVGGMAAVYAATHVNGKRVAVKVLHPDLARDESVRQRFKQEGYAANTIEHEGAVSVLDDDVAADGSIFIVMELLEGQTVAQRCERRGGTLPLEEVLAIADRLLDVLAAAHAKNVVHRDIKPDNLFLTADRKLKVLDFGIAKVFERREAAGATTRIRGAVLGTPGFMAPEQALGRANEIDGRTDLWCVGATMFTLLAGRHVHVAETSAEEMILAATTPAPPLAVAAPAVPAPIAAVVDRALLSDRAARWPDARSMQTALRRARQALATAARPGAPAPPRRQTVSGEHEVAPAAAPVGAAGVAAWSAERDSRQTEATRLRAVASALHERHVAAKKRAADAQSALEAARVERGSLERWLARQVGSRTAAVQQARQETNRLLSALGRAAIADRANFGDDFDAAREEVARLERAAKNAARDVAVHAAAIDAYDAGTLRLGVVMMGVGAVLGLTLVLAPIVWLATRVDEPAAPASISQPALPAAGGQAR